MKTTLKLFAMLMLVTFMASCSESSDELGTTQPTGEKVYMTFSGSADEEFSGGTDEELRTRINSKDNKKIDFAAGDAISVFDSKNSNNKFTTTEGGSQVKFSGTATQSDNYTFLYPYQNSATISGGKISAVIPAEQTATVGTFDPAANLSVAKADGKGVVNLKNICSLIRLNVAVNCASVTLTDLGGRAVAGAVTINPETYEVAPAATGASKSVTLKNLTAGKIYYIAILPGAIKLNLEIKLKDGGSVFTRTKSTSITLKRSAVLNVGKIQPEAKELWVDLGFGNILWAVCNIGATTINGTGVGNYYAWGEVSTKTTYNWSKYAYGKAYNATFSKYNSTGATLATSEDAARKNWGGTWRMPTKNEVTALQNTTNCTWVWKKNYLSSGHDGYLITSKKNSNYIFLPVTGYKEDSQVNCGQGTTNESGNYWTATQSSSDKGNAVYMDFNSTSKPIDANYRCVGRCVRAVRTK